MGPPGGEMVKCLLRARLNEILGREVCGRRRDLEIASVSRKLMSWEVMRVFRDMTKTEAGKE